MKNEPCTKQNIHSTAVIRMATTQVLKNKECGEGTTKKEINSSQVQLNNKYLGHQIGLSVSE